MPFDPHPDSVPSAATTPTAARPSVIWDRQTQSLTPQGGRLVTESVYDSHGWVRKKNNAYWDADNLPALEFASAQDSEIPNQDVFTFDGLGRTVVDDSEQYSVTKQTTITVYSGDTTTVIPPDGGTVKATTTDPLGRTASVVSYSTPPTLTKPTNTFTGVWSVSGGTSNPITYDYDGHGNQDVTESGGSTWTTTFDLLGRATAKSDPDAGTSTMVYDANGNLTQTTDARGDSVSFVYDALNRKTAQYAATTAGQAPTNQLASWVYDNDNAVANVKYPIGQLTTETAYNSGAAYVTQQLGYNAFGESLGQSVIIPASEGTLGRTWTFKHTYTADTGLLYSDGYPLAGGLPAQSVLHGYSTSLDLPNAVADTSYGYAQNTMYSAYGQILQETVGSAANPAYLTNTYDPHTGAPTDQLLTRSTQPAAIDDEAYTYDPAGNITRQTSTRLGATAATETQCYRYDELDRLTQAWTATDSCAATPTTAAHATVGDQLTGGSAYWTSWTFDILGQRTGQTDHSTTGAADTTTSYTYKGTGNNNTADQPHALTSTTSTGAGTTSTSYAYDADGNTLTRTTPAGTQNLTWNTAGQLTQVAGAGTGTTSYVYDADGNVLLQKDPGSTILYLPGQQITLNTATNTTTGVRYIALPGGGTAVRTGTGANYGFEFGDLHGTNGIRLDNTGQTPTWRQFTPYGDTRGTTVTWTDNRGFLDAPNNTNTGLTLLGARQYDPTIGRFISLDPLFEATDDQLLNGYSYTRDNPIGQADPTGLIPLGPTDGGTSEDYQWSLQNDMHDKVKHGPDRLHKGSGYYHDGRGFVWKDVTYISSISTDGHSIRKIPAYWHGPQIKEQVVVDHDTHQADISGVAGFLYAISGAKDLADCTQGSVMGCLATAANFVPGVDEVKALATALKGARDAEKAAKEAKAAEKATTCLLKKNSFAPDTEVLTSDGKSKPIKDLKVGDEVRTGDPATGRSAGSHEITATMINHDDNLVDVTVTTADGHHHVLHTTTEHPFWDDTTHTWVNAEDLIPGHALETAQNTHAYVDAVHPTPGAADRYNLTVQELHTYYVLAGGTPVLVHNSNCGGRWKLGDDYSMPNKNGVPPSLSTMRKRFWKNEAAEPDAADQYGAANIGRMKRGSAPQRQRPDGSWESMELSHEPIPDRDGGMLLTPRWPEDHAIMDPGGYRRLPPGY